MSRLRLPGLGAIDVLTNTSTAAVFAGVVALASRSLPHEVLAAMLLKYSLAVVAAWLLTLGAPTRYVSFSAPDSDSFTRAVWQTVLLALLLSGGLALLAWALPAAVGGERLRSLAIVISPVVVAYIGREVSNIAFGRVSTSFQCLAQTVAGAVISAVGYVGGWWSSETALVIFLAAHYANGSLQLAAYLVRHRPVAADLQMRYLRGSVRTNLALGAGTLLLGNFDKLALAFRPSLGGLESIYLIADRLTGVYGTVMSYYTQSRVQRAISHQSWIGRQAVRVIDSWFWHALPSVLLFMLVGSLVMGFAAPLLRIQGQPWIVASFVMVICLTLHLKNSSGYAIRLLDSLHANRRFNKLALTLVAAALISLSLCLSASIEVIVAIKLALHALMLQMLRRAANQLETNS